MEKYIWSLDISTTNIGSALWSDKGKLIELKHLELKNNKDIDAEDRVIYKAEIFKNYVQEYKNYVLKELNGEITKVIIEAPLGGSNNINTIALLFSFNGICTYILHKIFNLYPKKIPIYTIRKLFCNELVKISQKKNRKTGIIETVETLSFPEEYREKKKLYIWEKVAKYEPNVIWFYKKNSKELSDINWDLSDAYACGYSYFKQIGILK
jgi:hypothetical protein